jgi:hypothetical protein
MQLRSFPWTDHALQDAVPFDYGRRMRRIRGEMVALFRVARNRAVPIDAMSHRRWASRFGRENRGHGRGRSLVDRIATELAATQRGPSVYGASRSYWIAE